MTGDDRTETYQVLSDEPGLLLHRPRRQLARVLALYALLPLICAAAGSYITYTLSAGRSDHRIAALEADLAERRAARAQMDDQQRQLEAARAAADAQLRRDACVAFDRLQPRDAEVLDLRKRYGCTGNPKPAATAGPLTRPTADSRPGSQRGGSGGQDEPDPAPQAPPKAGPPGPKGPTGPQGPPGEPGDTPPDDGGLLCLPLVGCVL